MASIRWDKLPQQGVRAVGRGRRRVRTATLLVAVAGAVVMSSAAGAQPVGGVRRAAGVAQSLGPPFSAVNSPSIERVGDAPDLVGSAIAMSEDEFEAGEARVVILARDDLFADSLAGAALAGVHGPLLFTDGGPTVGVDAPVLNEVRRVLGPSDGECSERAVMLLGGTDAVSEAGETAIADAGYCTHRLSGATRVETATLIARLIDVRPRGIDRVLIARSDDWADAATAGAYAARLELPVLLTPPDQLHPAVEDYLRERRPAEIVLLGGERALSAEVQAAAAPLAGPAAADSPQEPAATAAVRRVAGATRQETSAAIAGQLWSALIPRSAMLLDGHGDNAWGYTLASSVVAARRGAPQLYVGSEGAASAVTEYLGSRTLDTIYLAGGGGTLADPLVGEVLSAMGSTVSLTGDSVSHFTGEAYGDLLTLHDSHFFIENGVQSPSQTGAMWPACSFTSERIGGPEPTEEMVVEARITRSYDPATCRRLVEVGIVDNNTLPQDADTSVPIEAPASNPDPPTPDVVTFCGPFPDCTLLGLAADKLNSYTYAAVLEPVVRAAGEFFEPTTETLTYINWRPTNGCAHPGFYHHFEGRDWLVAFFPPPFEFYPFTIWNLDFFVPDNQGPCSHVFSKIHAKFFNNFFYFCPSIVGGGLTIAHHFPNYTEGTAKGFTRAGANVTFDGNCSGLLSQQVLATPAPYRGEPAVPPFGVPGG